MSVPTEPFSNGRQADGRFGRGNKFGPGNPCVRYATKFRIIVDGVLDEVCTRERLKAALDMTMSAAESGDLEALKEIHKMLVGSSVDRALHQRVDEIEERIGIGMENRDTPLLDRLKAASEKIDLPPAGPAGA